MPTRLQPEWAEFNLTRQIGKFLGNGEPDYPDGRTAMYVCRCGDLDDPGVGARIHRNEDSITWTDWAWKDGFKLTEPIADLGTFTFELTEYESAFDGAAERLATVPDWTPPKDKMLWPWQWGWSLAANRPVKGKREALISREAVKKAFLDTDPAGIGAGGTWYPEAEYNTEVDRAAGWLAKGISAEKIAARTMRYLARDWGITVQIGKQEQLSRALDLISPRP
ncbi:hypothetical protein [Arthrobacter crystallopoietes]|uniref:hypothetical protein n=1 Tax=Crystallibacter crystallopoietes TaxID=37928 RepID=UPI001111053B|nr:hypothetical protein [Arthrobacter crystallopoietes]